MLYTLLNKIEEAPRESVLVVAAAAVIGALLSSMYVVCDGQVRAAQAYHASVKAQRLAMYDCLYSAPRASYAACANHVALIFQPQQRGTGTAHTVNMARASGMRSPVSAMVPVAYFATH